MWNLHMLGASSALTFSPAGSVQLCCMYTSCCLWKCCCGWWQYACSTVSSSAQDTAGAGHNG
jgi:hypothetical protein